jgi:hypothetical protein
VSWGIRVAIEIYGWCMDQTCLWLVSESEEALLCWKYELGQEWIKNFLETANLKGLSLSTDTWTCLFTFKVTKLIQWFSNNVLRYLTMCWLEIQTQMTYQYKKVSDSNTWLTSSWIFNVYRPHTDQAPPIITFLRCLSLNNQYIYITVSHKLLIMIIIKAMPCQQVQQHCKLRHKLCFYNKIIFMCSSWVIITCYLLLS